MTSRTIRRVKHDQPIEVAEPPIAEGTDAVAAWAHGVGLDLVRLAGSGAGTDADTDSAPSPERIKALRSALDALGRGRGAARDAEALLWAAGQRGDEVEDACGPAAPTDEVALVLWQFCEMARLCWIIACGPLEVVAPSLAQVRGLGANIRSRPTARAEEVRRRHRLPKDAREAVREHEEVSAKLEEEALDANVVREASYRLLTFCTYMKRYFKTGPHLKLICGALERIESGRCRRLIINMPPQHGKSEVVSRLFPAWYLGRNPSKAVLAATHTATYAERIGRNVRNNMGSNEFKRVFPDVCLADDSKAAAAFEIVPGDGRRIKRGQYLGYGMGGSYTGSPSNLMIFDDLLTEADANSDTALQTAYESIEALYSRLAPTQEGDAWVVVNTRYNLRDVVAYLLSEYSGEEWEVISLPAIAERDEAFDLPDGEVWERKEGEALFPDRYKIDRLIAIRDQRLQTNAPSWWGQYQCKPVPSEGNIVKLEWFTNHRYYDAPKLIAQSCTRITISVDTSKGATDKAARTAISVWGERGNGTYLLYCYAKPIPYTEQRDRIKAVCAEWRPQLLIIEDKSTGESLIPDLRMDAKWVGTPIYPEKPRGPKDERMMAITPQMADGQVWLPRDGHPDAPWLQAYVEEMAFYPKGVFRDMGDTTSQYLLWRSRNPLHTSTGLSTSNTDPSFSSLQRTFAGPWGIVGRTPSRRKSW